MDRHETSSFEPAAGVAGDLAMRPQLGPLSGLARCRRGQTALARLPTRPQRAPKTVTAC